MKRSNPAMTGGRMDDPVLLEEFADFMAGDETFANAFPSTPDPTFRRRLCQQAWRTFVTSHLSGGDETR